MPYAIGYNKTKKCYKVYNKDTKKVFAKCTSKKNAVKQTRLLRALQFNKDFVPRSTLRAQIKLAKKMGKTRRRSLYRKRKTMRK